MFRSKRNASSTDAPGRRSSSSRVEQRPTNEDLSSRYAFRRNRTLTGSSSARIASSNELNAEFKSPRAHVHHLTSLRRRLLMYFAGVGIVALGLYVLVSQLVATQAIQATDADVSFTDDTSARYEAAIESYYHARPVERFRFLLDETALTFHVQADNPEISSINVAPGSSPGEAAVSIEVRRPIARWSIDGSDQYVDGDGVVFSQSFYPKPTLQIVDNSGISAMNSQLVASDRFLGFIGRVVSKAESYDLAVDTVTIPAATTRQVALSLKQGSAIEYRLSVDRSPGEQVEDVSRISRYLSKQKIDPEYVDVRLSGKAFYR